MQGCKRWLLWLTLVAGVVVVSPGAQSQQLGGQRFSPASSEDGVLGTEGADRRVPLLPYFSLWFNYGLNPLVVLDGDEEVGAAVEHLVGADLVMSINVWEGLDLGLGLPMTIWQSGDDALAAAVGLPPADGFAIGDLTLRLAYRVHFSQRTALALHVPVRLPTAAEDDPLALGLSAQPTLALTHGFKPADLLFNISYLIREDAASLDFEGGQELGFRLASRVGLDSAWNTALLGEIGLVTQTRDFFGAAGTPIEGRLGLEHWFGIHWRLSSFIGTGFSTGVGAPDFRAGLALSFGRQPHRPRVEEALPSDRDADGILDDVDDCPDHPEDVDGFKDDDGCPDLDNDEDGFIDSLDACPNEPESQEGITNPDGCPDRILVEETQITPFEPIRFETGSDEISRESYAPLREVAASLQANSGRRLRIEGHTDSVGDDDANLNLSRDRAASVRRFLIQEGIDDDRLESEGYGESRPIADNDIEEGRQLNRRVEFYIIQ